MSRTRHGKVKDREGDDLAKKALGKKSLLDENHWSYLQKCYHLTPREFQVAQLVCKGLSNNETAEALRIKEGTVKTHLRSIYRRLNVKSKIRMLLKLVNETTNFSAQSRTAPPIPIVGIKKAAKKRSASAKDIQKK